jgi:periodic tryptophan protein 1
MSMITATSWVPRGHAAAFPTKYVFDDEEYGRIAKLAKLQLEEAEEDLEEAKAAENGESSSKTSNSITNGVSDLQLKE